MANRAYIKLKAGESISSKRQSITDTKTKSERSKRYYNLKKKQ